MGGDWSRAALWQRNIAVRGERASVRLGCARMQQRVGSLRSSAVPTYCSRVCRHEIGRAERSRPGPVSPELKGLPPQVLCLHASITFRNLNNIGGVPCA